ncbi:MAG: hypothetical protein IKT79_05060 [Akkermansia sp.]|nr:hypothetical protein [Akkermansia sp.]
MDESISVSISGAIALGNTVTIKGGSAMALVNAVPDLWCDKPTATTSVVTDVSRSFSNSDAQKMNASATVYGFGPVS